VSQPTVSEVVALLGVDPSALPLAPIDVAAGKDRQPEPCARFGAQAGVMLVARTPLGNRVGRPLRRMLPLGDRPSVTNCSRAYEEPARWGVWAVPCAVRDNDVRAFRKAKRRQKAWSQQRARTLTPLLPQLLETARYRRDWASRLLSAADAAGHGEAVTVDAITYRRHCPPHSKRYLRTRTWLLTDQGQRLDVTGLEAGCFWAWALIETL